MAATHRVLRAGPIPLSIIAGMNKQTAQGFTLYELMITVLIVGVVLAFGIPGMGEFTRNSQMASTANDLHSSFHLARSEAARAKDNITICASTNPMVAVPTCGGQLEDGWVVFQDTDGDIVVDAGEAVLKRFPPTPNDIVINNGLTAEYFSFAPTGLGRGTVGGNGLPMSVVILCDERLNLKPAAGGKSAARVLVVTPLGRATVLSEMDQVDAQGGC